VVNVSAVVDIEYFHGPFFLVDPVDDSISSPPRPMTSGQRPEERLADPARAQCQRHVAKLDDRGRYGFRQTLGDGPAGGKLIL
jgi:hypothetical protein